MCGMWHVACSMLVGHLWSINKFIYAFAASSTYRQVARYTRVCVRVRVLVAVYLVVIIG